MNAAEIMQAALMEGGHPELALYVRDRGPTRRLVMFDVPIDRRISEPEARAVHKARRLAYEATGIPTDDLISEDGYVQVCQEARP